MKEKKKEDITKMRNKTGNITTDFIEIIIIIKKIIKP